MRSYAYSRAYPEVIEAWVVTGHHDFAVRTVASDMESYDDLARNLFAAGERVRSFKMCHSPGEGTGPGSRR